MLYTGAQALPALKKWVESKPRLASLAVDIWSADYFGRSQIHEKMLADQMRVENYYGAISKHVREGDVVVDLGTGTGILAFFAALQNLAKVYAIEHSQTIEIAKKLAQANQLTNVEFSNGNSKDFEISGKADVIMPKLLRESRSQSSKPGNFDRQHFVMNSRRQRATLGCLLCHCTFALAAVNEARVPKIKCAHLDGCHPVILRTMSFEKDNGGIAPKRKPRHVRDRGA